MRGGKIRIEERGPLRATIEIKTKVSETSEITQKVAIEIKGEGITFDTQIKWNENRKFLKVEFPLTVFSSQAVYETQFGHLVRPNNKNTTWEAAKFEVVAHKFCVLQEFDFGVALLNDCKYGHACEGKLLRLSLLRSPKAPDCEF